jgi:protein-L-isoaspartate(D-aspartate) O-methyltransferase
MSLISEENNRQKSFLMESLSGRGFDPRIIAAFKKVKREDFVPLGQKEFAYFDTALPIGYGQTISQPFTIAFMLSLLDARPGQKILEVGSGSGYVLALLGELTKGGEIYGVEIVPELTARSREALKKYPNIKIFQAGQTLGCPRLAPFDRILASAAAARLPRALTDQLAADGILVCPVKNDIVKIEKQKTGPARTSFPGFAFVPLIDQ